jgi:hypothetical protein
LNVPSADQSGRCDSELAAPGIVTLLINSVTINHFVFLAVSMIRAASIIRAKQKEKSDSVDSVLWQNTKLPEKKSPEGIFEVLLYLHG